MAPNCNEMPYLRSFFLEGLRQQTFKDFEVIVVDGGSKDGSLEALESYRRFFPIQIIRDSTRNIGYCRNVGCQHANGEILVNTGTDIFLQRSFLKKLDLFYEERPSLIAVGGPTVPHGSHVPFVTHLAYGAFDLFRFLLTCKFMPLKKIRPAGNFLAIKKADFQQVGGYPNVKINEDGLLGYKLDKYWLEHEHKTAYFSLEFRVLHHVKRFEKLGGVRGIFYYIYVLYLVFPFLKPLLKRIETIRGESFANR